MSMHAIGVTTSKKIEKPFEVLARPKYEYQYHINRTGEYQVFRIRNTGTFSGGSAKKQKIRITPLDLNFTVVHKDGTVYKHSDEEALAHVAELARQYHLQVLTEMTKLDDGKPLPKAFEPFTQPMDISHAAKKQT